MNKVEFHTSKNRVYITQTELITATNVDSFITDCLNVINKSKPGFTVLIDMSAGTTGTPEADAKLAELRAHTASKNPKGIATVVSSAMIKALAKQKLKEFQLDIFATKEEAELYLDRL
ncbi:UNVERIFIED_CONTAM: hypothetical protein ABID98_005234 [Brevibacillus sp. OAP136]